jgi:cytoskeletal protein RodZ
MESIGRILQDARERLGLTLDEVERATRIRTYHLEAMEKGEFDALPSPVQARGFLHNYAEFLGLDADEILLQYAERIQARHRRHNARTPYGELPTRPSVQVRSRRPRWLSSDLFIAAGITIAILALLVWGGSSMMASLREDNSPVEEIAQLTAPSATSRVGQTEQVLGTAEILQGAPLATEVETIPTQSFIISPTNQVILQLVIVKRAWISVLVDGEEQVPNHRVTPGQTLEFIGENTIEVTTGNAAGLRVIFNGQDQGLMGELGQVVTRLWSREGILTPTPTQTGTPTPTPTSTETPMISATPSPTSTSADQDMAEN